MAALDALGRSVTLANDEVVPVGPPSRDALGCRSRRDQHDPPPWSLDALLRVQMRQSMRNHGHERKVVGREELFVRLEPSGNGHGGGRTEGIKGAGVQHERVDSAPSFDGGENGRLSGGIDVALHEEERIGVLELECLQCGGDGAGEGEDVAVGLKEEATGGSASLQVEERTAC